MHSLQQEKVRDIINSRHLAFPVKVADIHRAVKIAGFHVHSGLMLRVFSQHVSAQLAHLCILNSSSTTKHSSHADPQSTQNLLSNPLLPPLPILSWEVAGTHLAPRALRSSSGLPTHATGMFCLFLLWLQGPWSPPWPGNCSQGGIGARDKWWKTGVTELWSLNEQTLWLHGWVKAIELLRLSSTSAENF